MISSQLFFCGAAEGGVAGRGLHLSPIF